MKKLILIFFIVLLVPAIAMAATEAQKQAAIDSGLAYLAGLQQGDGRFDDGGDYYYDVASTGSAVLSFLEEGWEAGDNVYIDLTDNAIDDGAFYGDVVGNGLNYLLNQAQLVSISNEPAGNPDVDGNTYGVKFNTGIASRDTYLTGIVLPAIAASGTPDALVTTGALSGRTDGTGAGGAWTYSDVVQNTVEYFAYGQADPGNWAQGGWRYYADYGQADNSTAQWPVIGMLFAEKMGVSAPAFVESELDVWIDYIQDEANGGSRYDEWRGVYDTWGSNMSRTGGMLIEMAYSDWHNEPLGTDTTHYANNQAAVDAALAYVNANWQQGNINYWDGHFDKSYTMWAIYKGLQTTIGLDDTTTIANIRAFNDATMDLDDGDIWNWYEDYCEWLVDEFGNNGGYWNGGDAWRPAMSTAWGINILNATIIDEPDNPVPEPATILLFGLGLLGLAGVSRRRKY